MRFILSILFVLSYAQDIAVPDENIKDLGKGWYEATAWVEYHEDITKAQAKEKAISRAMKNIIETYSGMGISSTSGGIRKIELSINATSPSSATAWRCAARAMVRS